MIEEPSGFANGGRTWAPADSATLRGACGAIASQLGRSHGDRGVSTLVALASSMPRGVTIDFAKITDAQRKSLRAAVAKALKTRPDLPGLRELADLFA